LTQNLNSGRSIVRGRLGDSSNDVDLVGHGTHVAGIIAAQSNNQIGISGIAPDAKILPIRILDSRGDGSESDLAQAIRYAVDQGVRVINLSLGGATQTGGLQLALEYAAQNDVLVVAAAGNGGPTAGTTYPAGNDLTLAVTAIDPTLNAPSFNQRGSYIDISAPGINICSTVRIDAIVDSSRRCAGLTEPYVTMSGTSMAAAFVSGVAALIFGARPDFSALQAREVIIATAKDIGTAGRDETFGAGLSMLMQFLKHSGTFPTSSCFQPFHRWVASAKRPSGAPFKFPKVSDCSGFVACHPVKQRSQFRWIVWRLLALRDPSISPRARTSVHFYDSAH
jgi:subtilisin family serine protease